MHTDVGRENKKPGHEITATDFATEVAKEVGIAGAAIGAEYGFTHEPDGDRQKHKPYKQQDGEECAFFLQGFDDR